MSQNTLIEKINQDVATVVAEIKADEATKVADLRREGDRVIKTLIADRATAEKKLHDQIELVSVSQAKQAGKISVQRAKREQIDSLFADLEEELVGQTSEQYVAFFQKYGAAIIPAGAKVTEVQAPKDKLVETKQILEGLKLDGEISADISSKAGLLVHTDDGVYDVTLNRIMGEKRAELEMKVVRKVMTA